MGCGASRGDKQSEVVVDTRQDNAAPPVNLPGYPAELVASKALVADVLTEMLFNKLRTRSSDTGFTILDLVAPAYSSPQNKYGIVAGDASCFHSSAFRDVLLPVIEKAHGKPKPSGIYEGATSSTKAATDAVNAVTELDYVQMIRFEASRNLPDRRFVQAFSGSDEIGVEAVLKQKIERSADRYEGLYTTVGSLAPAERQMMDRLGFLPESDSTPMLSPRGKGVFVSGGRDLAVVVNGKDHVKVITQCVRNWEDGRFIFGVCNRSAGACQVSSEYNRLKDALATIFDNFSFAFDPQLGWLGGDLDRIGTSLSGHLGLSPENLLKAMTDNDQKPKLAAAFDAICADLGLKWKEDKTREGEGFIRMWFESSLGRSEIDCVQSLLDAVKRVVDLDTSFGLTPEEVEAEKLIDSFQQELLSARKEGDEEGNEEIKSNEAVAVGKAEAENDNNVHIEKADAELVDKVLSGTTSLEGALGKKAEVLEFIHFNDVYNIEPRENEPVGGAARFVGKLKELKQENENMLVFFSGDAFNPSMISTFAKGKQMVPVLNACGIHTSVFGNHDFDFGAEALIQLAGDTNFPWLISNVVDAQTKKPLCGGLEYRIFDWCGHKVGIVGIVEKEWLVTLSFLNEDDVIFEDFVGAGNRLAKMLREEEHCDMVIALTHMRVPNDRRLAEETSGIDVILGGHDHHYEVFETNGVSVIKSGTDFKNMSRVKVSYNEESKKYGFDVEKLEITSSCPIDTEIEKVVHFYHGKLVEEMEKTIGETSVPLDGKFVNVRSVETNLGNFITDIMRLSTDADVAWMNSGTLRSDDIHGPGPLKMKDLVAILPMLDEMAVIELTAEQLYAVAENGVSMYPKLEGRFPQISGVSFEFDPDKEPGSRVIPSSIKVAGEVVEPTSDRTFRVVTKGYLLKGKDGYLPFKEAKVLVPEESAGVLPTIVKDVLRALRGRAEGISLKTDSADYGYDFAVSLLEKAGSGVAYPLAPKVEGRLVNVRASADAVESEV